MGTSVPRKSRMIPNAIPGLRCERSQRCALSKPPPPEEIDQEQSVQGYLQGGKNAAVISGFPIADRAGKAIGQTEGKND